mgnify:CR=1 FL=1
MRVIIVAALLCASAACGDGTPTRKATSVDAGGNARPTRWKQVDKEVFDWWTIYTLRDSVDGRCFAVLDSRSYASLGPVPCPPGLPPVHVEGGLRVGVSP